MASLWLKLFSSSLICLSFIPKTVEIQENEFECVSIYKQSALQHPRMKDHQLQIRPSRELLSMLSTSNDNTIPKIDLKGSEECPKGQVPIHKPKTNLTNNLINSQQFAKARRLLKRTRGGKWKRNNLKPQKNKTKRPYNPPKVLKELNNHYAIVRGFKNMTKRWRGAQALFDIVKPNVTQDQYSKSWIWLNYIQESLMSSVQFGVAVHTTLYSDDRPRLTTFWMSEKQRDGCYNALCPGGYVQTHQSIFPGLVYDHVTVPGGKQNTVHLSVAEDPVTKNWILTIGTTMIGYWPQQTFMADGASEVFFGGFAGTALPYTPSPPMGYGDFPTNDLTRSCFMSQLKYILTDYTLVDINPNEMEYYVDNPKCYNVTFLKYVDYISRETLTFGGPGGEDCHT